MAKKKKVDEEVYHVEVITKARVGDEGQWEYLVKWAGYDSDDDSWEPAENVQQCDRLLASFWKHVGVDDNDYAIGYEAAAKDDWINKEKQYFAQNFLKQPKSKSHKESKRKEYQVGIILVYRVTEA
ncbi:hypothetical protein F5I97DRAFT_1895879 [Phlebopus sp. FC_14]|nr:hypothetical protein F5I97DRAFT_1895879 [Phlebopus sp. FC_14]